MKQVFQYHILALVLLLTGVNISRADLPCYEISPKKTKPTIICCNEKVPGFLDANNPASEFISLKEKRSKALKNGKLKKALELKRYLLEARPLCRSFVPGEGIPTPIGTINPIPTATATPVTPAKNFDNQGNVTDAGKDCFRIPRALSANVLEGSQHVNQYCVTCHGPNLLDVPNAILFDREFTFTRERTRVSPMNFNEQSLTDDVLADIAAFLNRYRDSGC